MEADIGIGDGQDPKWSLATMVEQGGGGRPRRGTADHLFFQTRDPAFAAQILPSSQPSRSETRSVT